ncbi:MAG TPA: hypothetical protein EYN38_11190 [Flavobacteriales bacterium]|nr:hypothetical protein [Flavobacteriales bacterium]
MSSLSREQSIDALRQMHTFHTECRELFSKYGFDLMQNLGRRNIVMSQAHEKFFADVLSSGQEEVSCDGRTGQADIIIGGLNKELECKLTSRHQSGAISFHSDYETLLQKGSLDYLYIIADDNFEKFVVLHFEDLNVNDFRPLSNGSRGKVAMYKHKGMKKCRVLVGQAQNNKEKYLKAIRVSLSKPNLTSGRRLKLQKRLDHWRSSPASYTYLPEAINAN